MAERNKTIIEAKSFEFAVSVIGIYKYLSENKKEYVLSKQLLRSGTSIGANISEAERGQSTADFLSKMSIALKEANESEYWLRLLNATGYLSSEDYDTLYASINELIRILSSICSSTALQLILHSALCILH